MNMSLSDSNSSTGVISNKGASKEEAVAVVQDVTDIVPNAEYDGWRPFQLYPSYEGYQIRVYNDPTDVVLLIKDKMGYDQIHVKRREGGIYHVICWYHREAMSD